MNESRDLDLQGLFAALRRRLRLVVLCVVLTAGAALAVSLVQTKLYTADASLLFRDPGFDERLFGSPVFSTPDPDREAATNVELVSLEAVADRTAEDLGAGLTGSDISDMVEVQAEGQADLVSVAATDDDPESAASVANSFAESYIEFRRDADRAKIQLAQRLIERDLENFGIEDGSTAEVRSLQDQLSELRTLEALQTGNAELVQRADAPASPSSPNVLRNAFLGGMLGLLLGVSAALMLERLDRRLREPEEFEAAYDSPVLARVPKSDLLDAASPDSAVGIPEVDAFRMLRTRLRYFNVGQDIRSLLITSAVPGEGKSTIAWNMAMTAADAGIDTVLVEADFHQPVIAERVGLAPVPGLSELLTHQGSLAKTLQSVPVSGGSGIGEEERQLGIIVAGTLPPNPTELLESTEIVELLNALVTNYQLVIVDTPPVTVVADTIPLMSLVNGVVVVGRQGITTRDAAHHLRDQLQRLSAPMLGVVMNGTSASVGYYYGSYSENAQAKRFSRWRRGRKRKPGANASGPTS